jgi:hypothetical protein
LQTGLSDRLGLNMADNVEEKLDALVARVTKVRRWLVTLAVLKIAALCLVFVSLYVGVYAWLDHRRNFDEVGRITAFVLLLTGFTVLLIKLTKSLLVHLSCSEAANYIENIRSFDQQLVTAIEYYENKHDYPYSKALAEQLVLNVDKESEKFRFDSTVEKWKGYALSAVILFGLFAAWFYVHDNYVYFSSYFARLIRPLASVEPLSATSLQSMTEDIITEPDSKVTFTAEIKGRAPEFGKLVLVGLEPEVGDESLQAGREELQVRPDFDEEKMAKFEVSKSFSQTGRFKYRFEAGSASTDWKTLTVCEPPEVEGMTADVTLPQRPPRRKWIKPYTEQIEDNVLEVIQRSEVTLNVQATDKLKEVVITGSDGKQLTRQLNGVKQFSYSFTADTSGSFKFQLVNEQGLANEDVPDLEVRVKMDEPPKFKLVSPEGDYLATDVASVPISFEVTDDFGLDSASMYIEIPGWQPEETVIPIEEGVRSKVFTHIIELENYNLNVGDSILFYAQAGDIDTGSALEKRTSKSEVYFIEIRPYRQNWRPRPGGGPSQAQGGGSPPVELLNILEYTRAILKKTWDIAGKSSPTEQDRSRLGFINNDVRYCAEQLALIRDDSEYGFNDTQKAVLNAVLGYYGQASRYLDEHNAASAIAPEKSAYLTLRKFILELDLELNPPESGQGQQPERPDSVKLQEMQYFSEEDKERIEEELRKLQQKLKKVTREQKDLKRTFENFLEQQAREKEDAEQKSDSEQSGPGEEKQTRSRDPDKEQVGERGGQKDKSASGSSGAKSQSASNSQNSGRSQTASDSSSVGNKQGSVESRSGSQGQNSGKEEAASDGRGTSGGKSTGKEQKDGQVQGSDKSGTAIRYGTSYSAAQAKLRMMQAKQRALYEQVSQLKRDLQRLPEVLEGGQAGGRSEAQKHLDEALAKMDNFQEVLSEARYDADVDKSKSNRAVELMESAERELDLAQETLDDELALSEEQRLAQEAQEIAEQLADDADALDGSVTPLERAEMLARLEAAKRLLEKMPEPQWATIENKQNKGTSSSAPVFTRNPNLSPAEAARQMARQFWSIAINAKKYRQQLIEDEPSDVKFYGQENEFFENAAKFDQEAVKK